MAVSVVFLLKRYGKLGQLRPLFLLLLFAYLELVLFALVLGRPIYRGQKAHLVPLYTLRTVSIKYGLKYILRETVLNVFLFLPAGMLLQKIHQTIKWNAVLLFGAAVSLSIELLQIVCSRGVFETDDIVLNTIGAFLGFILMRKISAFFLCRSKTKMERQ